MNFIFRLDRAVQHANLQNHAAILVKESIEDEGLQRGVRITRRRRQLFDNAFEDFLDVQSGLRGDGDGFEGIEPQFSIDGFLGAFDVGSGEVDLVDDREQF